MKDWAERRQYLLSFLFISFYFSPLSAHIPSLHTLPIPPGRVPGLRSLWPVFLHRMRLELSKGHLLGGWRWPGQPPGWPGQGCTYPKNRKLGLSEEPFRASGVVFGLLGVSNLNTLSLEESLFFPMVPLTSSTSRSQLRSSSLELSNKVKIVVFQQQQSQLLPCRKLLPDSALAQAIFFFLSQLMSNVSV